MNQRRFGVVVVEPDETRRRSLDARLEHLGVEVFASVPAPLFALSSMNRRWPDALVLGLGDRLDCGLRFLGRVLSIRPTPTLVSASRANHARAWSHGAIQVVSPDQLEPEAARLLCSLRAEMPGQRRRN